jgi:hypothetical protein
MTRNAGMDTYMQFNEQLALDYIAQLGVRLKAKGKRVEEDR